MKCVRSLAGVVLLTVTLVGMIGCVVTQPSFQANSRSAVTVPPDRLREHVVTLSEELHPRDWTHMENLEKCAEYISDQFKAAGAQVFLQPVEARGNLYRNVIGTFGAPDEATVVVGAHYDACRGTPGADDNASGVAVLIELAHLFGKCPLGKRIELVAYTLEEPPFFRTQQMGSAVHAASLADTGRSVEGVVVLEMVGCFKDERGTQGRPSLLLKCLYPSRGNFIGLVGRWDHGRWIKRIKAGMKGTTDLVVRSIRAPASVPGVDFSDHLNYWPYGIPALMVTDTGFYRNTAYHTEADTADRLDYSRMSQVAVAVFEAVSSL